MHFFSSLQNLLVRCKGKNVKETKLLLCNYCDWNVSAWNALESCTPDGRSVVVMSIFGVVSLLKYAAISSCASSARTCRGRMQKTGSDIHPQLSSWIYRRDFSSSMLKIFENERRYLLVFRIDHRLIRNSHGLNGFRLLLWRSLKSNLTVWKKKNIGGLLASKRRCSYIFARRKCTGVWVGGRGWKTWQCSGWRVPTGQQHRKGRDVSARQCHPDSIRQLRFFSVAWKLWLVPKWCKPWFRPGTLSAIQISQSLHDHDGVADRLCVGQGRSKFQTHIFSQLFSFFFSLFPFLLFLLKQ